MATRHTARVDQDLGQTSGSASANFTPDTLSKIDDTRPDSEPPAEISETVLSRVEREGLDVVRINGIPNEATGRVSVKAKHEEESKMMRVPESLEALGADFVVSSGVHQHHDEQHEMASDTTRLGVVDLLSGLLSDF